MVTPPIDARETFVSLSKNITDSDISMEVKLRSLYKIQQTDTKIDNIHLLRGELPEEVRDLEDEIAGLGKRVSKFKEEYKDIERTITDSKLKITESKSSIVRYEEQRLNVKNNREYDSLSKEIEFQGLEVEYCEKLIAENSELLSLKKDAITETQKILSGREQDLVTKKKELESIIEETAKEEEVLIAEVKELEKNVDERMLAAYHRVRSNAKNRLAVVKVQRNACGGCFNNIPPQRQLDIALSKKIIVCEYCGRILVSPEFDE